MGRRSIGYSRSNQIIYILPSTLHKDSFEYPAFKTKSRYSSQSGCWLCQHQQTKGRYTSGWSLQPWFRDFFFILQYKSLRNRYMNQISSFSLQWSIPLAFSVPLIFRLSSSLFLSRGIWEFFYIRHHKAFSWTIRKHWIYSQELSIVL